MDFHPCLIATLIVALLGFGGCGGVSGGQGWGLSHPEPQRRPVTVPRAVIIITSEDPHHNAFQTKSRQRNLQKSAATFTAHHTMIGFRTTEDLEKETAELQRTVELIHPKISQ